jgi:hypothetical protein
LTRWSRTRAPSSGFGSHFRVLSNHTNDLQKGSEKRERLDPDAEVLRAGNPGAILAAINVNQDFSQANNLAEQNPEKLKALQAAFDVEAKKYNVYPLDSSFASRADPAIRPSLTR